MTPKISFCVTSCNRWYQLSKTLRHNLDLLGGHELVVVNYGSRDEIDTEMRAYEPDMKSGKLKYFHTSEPQKYNSPKAKNLAHRLGTNEFLFNLDGDNFLDAPFIAELESIFTQHPSAVIHAFDSKVYVPGTYGRIGMHRDNFYGVGGYNEGFLPMGFQDTDLILRLNYLGLPCIATQSNTVPPLFNSVASKGGECSKIGGEKSYLMLRNTNWQMSFVRLRHVGPILEQNFATFNGALNFGPEFVFHGSVPNVALRLPSRPEDYRDPKFRLAVLGWYEDFCEKENKKSVAE